MPTILKIKNIKFYFYNNEGKRAHVHVKIAEYEIQVWLDNLSIKKGCSDKKVQAKLLLLVIENKELFAKKWIGHFGE